MDGNFSLQYTRTHHTTANLRMRCINYYYLLELHVNVFISINIANTFQINLGTKRNSLNLHIKWFDVISVNCIARLPPLSLKCIYACCLRYQWAFKRFIFNWSIYLKRCFSFSFALSICNKCSTHNSTQIFFISHFEMENRHAKHSIGNRSRYNQTKHKYKVHL